MSEPLSKVAREAYERIERERKEFAERFSANAEEATGNDLGISGVKKVAFFLVSRKEDFDLLKSLLGEDYEEAGVDEDVIPQVLTFWKFRGGELFTIEDTIENSTKEDAVREIETRILSGKGRRVDLIPLLPDRACTVQLHISGYVYVDVKAARDGQEAREIAEAEVYASFGEGLDKDLYVEFKDMY